MLLVLTCSLLVIFLVNFEKTWKKGRASLLDLWLNVYLVYTTQRNFIKKLCIPKHKHKLWWLQPDTLIMFYKYIWFSKTNAHTILLNSSLNIYCLPTYLNMSILFHWIAHHKNNSIALKIVVKTTQQQTAI